MIVDIFKGGTVLFLKAWKYKIVVWLFNQAAPNSYWLTVTEEKHQNLLEHPCCHTLASWLLCCETSILSQTPDSWLMTTSLLCHGGVTGNCHTKLSIISSMNDLDKEGKKLMTLKVYAWTKPILIWRRSDGYSNTNSSRFSNFAPTTPMSINKSVEL